MAASLILLAGCASRTPSQFAGAASSLQAGKPDLALAQINASGADPQSLLYNFEYGEVSRLQDTPDIAASTGAFLTANAIVKQWQDDTGTNLSDASGNFAAYVLSDTTRPYYGRSYEQSLLNYRLALNRVAVGEWDTARVETQRLQETETFIKREHEAEINVLTKKSREESVSNVPSYHELGGYPVETLDDPAVTGLKNSYESAASHYLAGFIFEALGEKGLAAPGYRNAIQIRPNEPFLQDALKSLDKRRIAQDQTDTLFVVETGGLSPIESQKISIPIPIPSRGVVTVTAAYPVIRPTPFAFAPGQLTAGNTAVPLSLTTDIDAMSRRAIRDDMPLIITRNITRNLISASAQVAAQQIGKKGDQVSPVGALAGLAIGIGSAAIAEADTRHWTTLPSGIFLGRATLKSGGNDVTIPTPSGPQTVHVDLQDRHDIVYLRELGGKLVVMASKPQALKAS